MKNRPGGHRMLPPAAGTLEDARPRHKLVSRPPVAPRARKTLGPTQSRQRRDTRRLVPIAIHEPEKSNHRSPLPPTERQEELYTQ